MTDDRPMDFQRARNAEQREARKEAILKAAEELLTEMPVSDISLRELSRRVGLSKTNVVRYFETREAVFFELLNRSFEAWLEALPAQLTAPASPASVVDSLARSLAGRPVLCGLFSSLGTELERNISSESARVFKLANTRLQGRLADRLRQHVPDLTQSASRELVSLTIVLTAGLWPFANPSPAVAEALEDSELAHTRVDFAERLSRALHVAVTGLIALS